MIRKLVNWFDQAPESPLGVGYEADEEGSSVKPVGSGHEKAIYPQMYPLSHSLLTLFWRQRMCF